LIASATAPNSCPHPYGKVWRIHPNTFRRIALTTAFPLLTPNSFSASIGPTCSQPAQSADDVFTPIARAHAVLAVQNRRKKQPEAKQLNLL
jgi:hypothetical protein